MKKASVPEMTLSETLSPKTSPADSSAVGKVMEAIRNGIRDGVFRPGQRLTEAALTERFGVSRGPVREALSRLEVDGLLVFEQNRGVSVRKLSRDDIVNMLEVREFLEGLAARTAARLVRDDASKAQLRQLHDNMKAAVGNGDIELYNVYYVQLHTLLVTFSANPLLEKMVLRLNLYLFRGQLSRLIDMALVKASHREHEALIAALVANEPDKAERAIRKHIAHFTEHIRALPGSFFD